jgi:bile acid:Na+ symporter, BASS family
MLNNTFFGRFFQKNWFLLGLFVVVYLGLKFPETSIMVRPYVRALIVISMFLIGLRINLQAVTHSITSFRASALCLVCSFVFMPAISYLLGELFYERNSGLYIGIILTSAVATTQASSVIWTALSKGNQSLALVLMLISNVCGIFLLPIILRILLHTEVSFSSSQMMGTLIVFILLPTALGICVNGFFAKKLEFAKKASSKVNIFIIWIIVLSSLSNAHSEQIPIFLLCITIPIQYLSIAFLSFFLAKVVGLNLPDRIAVMFCSTQKTINTIALIGLLYFDASSLIYGVSYHIFQQLMGEITRRHLLGKSNQV